MGHLAESQISARASLRQRGRESADRLRNEIEERISIARAQRLDREFNVTPRSNPRRLPTLRDGSPVPKHSNKARLRLGSSHVPNFSLPIVVNRARRLSEGRRCFAFKMEAIPKSAVNRRLASGTKIGPGAAASGARYAVGERSDYLIGDRTQLAADCRPLIVTNINDHRDPDDCVEFFNTVEHHERKPSLDQGTIDFGRCPWLWRRVTDHPKCEPAVVAAYRADPNDTAVIELKRGADALREVMADCDHRAKVKKCDRDARDRDDGIQWRLGRGGRTQWRIVVAFPAEFTPAQRQEGLEVICAHFGAMGCMYMGVIHEPAASNDPRNDHCHIDIYDRPCRRLTGNEDDDLAHIPERWKKEVTAEYRAGAFDEAIRARCWDFAQIRSVKYGSGNRGTHRIFGANKSTAMRAYSVPKDSRRHIAAIINGIAIRDFGRELSDHRSYAQMGIEKEPDEPLGPNAHALEGKGVASVVGLRNEERHAEARRREIERQHRNHLDQMDAYSADLDLCGSDQAPEAERQHEIALAKAAIVQAREMADLQRDTAILQLEINRQLSAAYHVIKTSNRVIRLGDDKRGCHAERLDSARQYWRSWVKENADDVRCLKEMKAQISTLNGSHDLAAIITAAVAPSPTDVKKPVEVAVPGGQPILMTKRLSALLQSRAEPSPELASVKTGTIVSQATLTDASELVEDAVWRGQRVPVREEQKESSHRVTGNRDELSSAPIDADKCEKSLPRLVVPPLLAPDAVLASNTLRTEDHFLAERERHYVPLVVPPLISPEGSRRPLVVPPLVVPPLVVSPLVVPPLVVPPLVVPPQVATRHGPGADIDPLLTDNEEAVIVSALVENDGLSRSAGEAAARQANDVLPLDQEEVATLASINARMERINASMKPRSTKASDSPRNVVGNTLELARKLASGPAWDASSSDKSECAAPMPRRQPLIVPPLDAPSMHARQNVSAMDAFVENADRSRDRDDARNGDAIVTTAAEPCTGSSASVPAQKSQPQQDEDDATAESEARSASRIGATARHAQLIEMKASGCDSDDSRVPTNESAACLPDDVSNDPTMAQAPASRMIQVRGVNHGQHAALVHGVSVTSAEQVPARQMFGYIQAQGWALKCDGPRGDELIVFAEPQKVPPDFQRWLSDHQNFAPWIYSFQRQILKSSDEPIATMIDESARSKNLAAAYREASIEAFRRSKGMG